MITIQIMSPLRHPRMPPEDSVIPIQLTFERILVFAKTPQEALIWIYDTQQSWGLGLYFAHHRDECRHLFDVFRDPGQLKILETKDTALIFLEGWTEGFNQAAIKKCFVVIAGLQFPYRFTGDWQPWNPFKTTVKEALNGHDQSATQP